MLFFRVFIFGFGVWTSKKKITKPNNRQFWCTFYYYLLSVGNDLQVHKIHGMHTHGDWRSRPTKKRTNNLLIYEKYCLFSETIYNFVFFIWEISPTDGILIHCVPSSQIALWESSHWTGTTNPKWTKQKMFGNEEMVLYETIKINRRVCASLPADYPTITVTHTHTP